MDNFVQMYRHMYRWSQGKTLCPARQWHTKIYIITQLIWIFVFYVISEFAYIFVPSFVTRFPFISYDPALAGDEKLVPDGKSLVLCWSPFSLKYLKKKSLIFMVLLLTTEHYTVIFRWYSKSCDWIPVFVLVTEIQRFREIFSPDN